MVDANKTVDFSSIFITEDNTFDISVKYYYKDGKIFVKNIDEDFDDKNERINDVKITLKYPSHGDRMSISGTLVNMENMADDIRIFLKMEYNRFLILARKWNVSEKITESDVLKLNPKIVKGIFNEIREKIGTEGIF